MSTATDVEVMHAPRHWRHMRAEQPHVILCPWVDFSKHSSVFAQFEMANLAPVAENMANFPGPNRRLIQSG